ncbi:transglycosylase domain-containing protein [Aridibaculum aurantiacum]|uniref:transglycosylase domain-containing protein n=1 Tax=Aridibaculum aurantiacum TaxID=2810307 RepID=UPI001A95DBFC|nr:transglycosylase domain-containing protein [Aridibaculum aurantiacum]
MRRSVKIFWRLVLIGFASFVLILLLANWGVFGKMPSIEDLENPSASIASEVIADDGTVMGKYYLEDRTNVEFHNISKHIVSALIATEDERFYSHSGIDGRSLARAVVNLGKEGGASTISQQLALNLFTGNRARNPVSRGMQKLKEWIIAIKLERNFTKDEILALYLNTVPFGDNVYGIRNASRTFFQKDPDVINIEEAAVLVGMLKGSTLYNPRVNPKLALDRRNTVLEQMVRNKFLTDQEAQKLKLKPIALNYKKMDENAGLAPYFRMVLGQEMKKWCKEHKKPNGDNYDLYRDGLKIYTTLNPRMQLYAEEAVSKHISYMQKILNSQSNIKNGSVWKGREDVLNKAMKDSDRWKNLKKDGLSDEEIKKTFSKKVPMKIFAWNNKRETDTTMTPMDSIKYHRQMLQAGFMVMDPISGEIKAWVGGIDFKNFKFDHVNPNTRRQVGSTIKPLLYGLAVEEAGFTPNTTVVDVQQSFGSYGQVPATGASCTGRSMPMSSALAQSRNCASAYIMKQLGNNSNDGPRRFVEFLQKTNMQAKVDAYPSIALGSCEISLYEMMQAYSMFPGRGFNSKPLMIARIEDKNGNVLENFLPAQRKEIISEVTAYTIALMMQGVIKNGTGRRMASYGINGEVAGKTGTTNDNSDAWFMGYTPQLLAGAWVGCDDRFIRFNSTNVGQGSSAALPIWAYFFSKAYDDKTLGIDREAKFSKPEVMSNDIIFDYLNNIRGYQPGAEGEDMGNGSSEDYLIPQEGAMEIGAESEIPVEKAKPGGKPADNPLVPKVDAQKPPSATQAPAEEEDNLSRREKRRLRREQERKEKENNNQQNQQPPKAVMPRRD